jgi:hypothetical protein
MYSLFSLDLHPRAAYERIQGSGLVITRRCKNQTS